MRALFAFVAAFLVSHPSLVLAEPDKYEKETPVPQVAIDTLKGLSCELSSHSHKTDERVATVLKAQLMTKDGILSLALKQKYINVLLLNPNVGLGHDGYWRGPKDSLGAFLVETRKTMRESDIWRAVYAYAYAGPSYREQFKLDPFANLTGLAVTLIDHIRPPAAFSTTLLTADYVHRLSCKSEAAP